MPLRAVLYHGWGFDAGLWNNLAELLPGWTLHRHDRGYFGAPAAPEPEPEPEGHCIAVTHSFGTMIALRNPPPGCAGIVAVNGFDRFAAAADFPGVALRILQRMISRFDVAPHSIVADFRQRCGSDAPFADEDVSRLGRDLRQLAEFDCRSEAALAALPILSLQGEGDPILPALMRGAVFARARNLERRTLEGGHLLPLEQPAACAQAVREFAKLLD